MAKKKPTHKNIRQGHTLYHVELELHKQLRTVVLTEYFIYSQKEPLPPEGCILEKMPVSHCQGILKRFGNTGIYFSKRKAKREVNRINGRI